MNLNKRSQEVHLASLGVGRRGTKDVGGGKRGIKAQRKECGKKQEKKEGSQERGVFRKEGWGEEV